MTLLADLLLSYTGPGIGTSLALIAYSRFPLFHTIGGHPSNQAMRRVRWQWHDDQG